MRLSVVIWLRFLAPGTGMHFSVFLSKRLPNSYPEKARSIFGHPLINHLNDRFPGCKATSNLSQKIVFQALVFPVFDLLEKLLF